MAVPPFIDLVERNGMRSAVAGRCEAEIRRVLHVVGGMSRGGSETWLMHVLRRVDPARHRMDFLVRATQEQAHDAEIRALGGQVLACADHHLPWRFARRFADILRQHGPYHVVHAHLPYYSGFVLRLAAHNGVPVRIIHSHNDLRAEEGRRGRIWRLYCAVMRREIRRHATLGLAASRQAAEDLFGPAWQSDARFRVLHCGIDLQPFQAEVDRGAVRSELGFPPDALVVGHAGRFAWQKNHAFLLRVAAEAVRREPRTRVLLLGDGPLRTEMEREAAVLGIADRVLFAGSRDDVPRLMAGAMDVFLLPSHHEGLSVALLEAQAAGLPCVLSAELAKEGDVARELIWRLPLSAPAEQWAGAVLAAAARGRLSSAQALYRLRWSPFDIAHSAAELLRLYDDLPR